MDQTDYKNPDLPVSARVKDLLGRMSLNEKVNQLGCELLMGSSDASGITDGIGEIAFGVPDITSPIEKTGEMVRMIQEQVIRQSPHGIPAIFHCEALSGPVMPQCCIFPTSISLGATFSPEDVRDMADRIRKQMLATGVRQALSPVLDLARDFRWGRTNETYGNDPTLVSDMSCAFVEGLQGDDLTKGVAATAKHFLGYSQTEGGLNMTKTLFDKRDLRESFAKPFEAVIRKSNIKSVMNAYSAMDGEPICASTEVLTNLLREDLGFNGLVVSDYMSIPRLVDPFHTAEDMTDAAIQCLEAGLDVECPVRMGYGSNLREAVKSGLIDEKIIDRSVERVLTLKFELGLFEHPYPILLDDAGIDNSENNRRSEEVTKKVITLTKNEGVLPIKNTKLKVAVIGPTGNNVRTLFGSYTFPASIEMGLMMSRNQQGGMAGMPSMEEMEKSLSENTNTDGYFDEVNAIISSLLPQAKTIYSAVGEIFEDATYTQGCYFSDNSATDFGAAVAAAQKADIVFMTAGGKNGWGRHCTSGEGNDTASIGLPGRQHDLVEKVYQANKNMILVHTDNKPLVDEFIYENVPAIIEAWLPGTYGAQAIMEVITGKYNPGGRLPVDVPRSVGQLPAYHYQQNGCRQNVESPNAMVLNGYMDQPTTLRLPFGFGLSYTQFEYSNFKMDTDKDGEIPVVKMRVTVKNIGGMAGDEVVQLYGKDKVASVIRPQQELIGFKRITLDPQESKTVEFTFRLDQLAFINTKGNWVVEKGDFSFFIAPNSRDVICEQVYKQDKTIVIDHSLRGFFADTNEIPQK